MSRTRKSIWRPMVLLLAVLTGLLNVDAVLASQYDAARKGSIQVKLNDLGTEREGVSVTCYQAAVAVPNGENRLSFTSTAAFEAADVDWAGIQTASDSKEAAQRLAKLAESSAAQGTTKTTDADGSVIFSGLEQGIYLIVQSGEASYGTFAPFLALLPYSQDGSQWIYDIETQTKGETPPEPEPEKPEPEKPEPEPEKPDKPDKPGGKDSDSSEPEPPRTTLFRMLVPRTGDDTVIVLYVVLLLAAAAGILVVRRLYKKKK